MTHITYKTAKRLKEFLGESAPEPLAGEYVWQYPTIDPVKIDEVNEYPPKGIEKYPAYQLHDLLSKPFCEAFIRERFSRGLNSQAATWEVVSYLERVVNANYSGGLPAVEKALKEMMK